MENQENKEQVVQQNQNANQDTTKIYRILSYIGILWIIGLFVNEKDRPEVKFHVGQGMLLSIVNVGLAIIMGIISFIFGFIFGLAGLDLLAKLFGVLFTLIGVAIDAGTLVLMILGIINANNNENKPLPLIGKFAFYK